MPDSLGITGYQNWYFAFSNAISANGNLIALTAYLPGQFQTHSFLLILDTIVPVELISFNGEVNGNSIQLSWVTGTETNNSGFEIERKSETSDWLTITFVPGFGTSTETHSYSYEDNVLDAGRFSYRLKQINFDGTFEYSDPVNIVVSVPGEFTLKQNYPNPFNPSTTIEFNIAEQGLVNLSVYNLLGEKVATMVNEMMESGNHKFEFNASNLASGIYLVKMSSVNFSDVIKINLLK